MVRLGQPMFDFVLSTSLVEHMHAQARRWPVSARRLVAELHAVVGQDGADFVWNGLDERVEKRGRGMHRGVLFHPSQGEASGAVVPTDTAELSFLFSDLA